MSQPGIASFDRKMRMLLLRLRVHRLKGPTTANPNSVEYLYLVQQSKRLSLATTVGRFSRWNVLFWPFLLIIVFTKWMDLSLTTTLIKSLINESMLERLSYEGRLADARSIKVETARLGEKDKE